MEIRRQNTDHILHWLLTALNKCSPFNLDSLRHCDLFPITPDYDLKLLNGDAEASVRPRMHAGLGLVIKSLLSAAFSFLRTGLV